MRVRVGDELLVCGVPAYRRIFLRRSDSSRFLACLFNDIVVEVDALVLDVIFLAN